MIGSTTKLLRTAVDSDHDEFIVVTEPGIITQMKKAAPHKTYIPAPPQSNCACNECPFMRLNTLEKLRDCLDYLEPEITIPEPVRLKAERSVRRMLELSR